MLLELLSFKIFKGCTRAFHPTIAVQWKACCVGVHTTDFTPKQDSVAPIRDAFCAINVSINIGQQFFNQCHGEVEDSCVRPAEDHKKQDQEAMVVDLWMLFNHD